MSAMFEVISYYANVRFNYVGSFSTPAAAYQGGSDLTITLSGNTTFFPSTNILARAFFPTTSGEDYLGAAGDVFLNINSQANSYTTYLPGSAGWFVFLHEVGHALGLKHPFDNGGTGHPTLSELGLGELEVDWATIMAYRDDYDYNLRQFDPATPMLLDVLALQHLYGPNLATNVGDTLYELQARNLYYSVWDAGGSDEVSALNSDRGWEIYLPDEVISTLRPVNVGYAVPLGEIDLVSPRTLAWLIGDIERARGSNFADDIYGSVLDNVISGQGGDDYILGWHGNDILDGGAGNDEIYGGLGDDDITDLVGRNFLRGEEGNDRLIGGSGFDDMHGNMGNDTVLGGAFDDWVVGGKDNDLLRGEDGGDLVYGNLGDDTCEGGSGNDVVRGGQQNDTLSGGAGDDFMSGDRDADTISGGSGADTFHTHGDAGLDRVLDFNAAEGDRVFLLAGTQYTVSQVAADTVINMTGGGQMVLVGVTTSTLPAGWIFGA